MNGRALCFFAIGMILSTLLFGNGSNTDPHNLFINPPNYLEVLKIKPNLILDASGKPDLILTTKSLREDFLNAKTLGLKGYYGVLFNDKKILFFTKLSKDGNLYKSLFVTEQVLFHASLLEKSKDYFETHIYINYRHDKLEDLGSISFGVDGLMPLINGVMILNNFNHNVYFFICKLH